MPQATHNIAHTVEKSSIYYTIHITHLGLNFILKLCQVHRKGRTFVYCFVKREAISKKNDSYNCFGADVKTHITLLILPSCETRYLSS